MLINTTAVSAVHDDNFFHVQRYTQVYHPPGVVVAHVGGGTRIAHHVVGDVAVHGSVGVVVVVRGRLSGCLFQSPVVPIGHRLLVYNNSYSTELKEGNLLFNDALNTFYLWLYGIGHVVKDHSVMRWETRCRHMGYSSRLAARVHPIERVTHTTAFVTYRGTLAGTRNSAMGFNMKNRSDKP